jgi:predicted outer membrane protein
MSKLTPWVALLVLAATVVVAQERQPIPQTERPAVQAERPGFQTERAGQIERPGTATRPGAPSLNLDQQFIACLIIDNKGEVELAKFAQARAQSKEVKDFAEQMINDHGEFVTKLQQLQAANGATPRDARTERRRGDETLPARRPGVAADATAERGGPQHIMLQIKKEIAERCLASVKRELEQKKGSDFDRCYMGSQQMAHMKMVDELAVLEKYASPELQKALAQASQTARTHLTHAKTLLAKLEGASAETARRPDDSEKK